MKKRLFPASPAGHCKKREDEFALSTQTRSVHVPTGILGKSGWTLLQKQAGTMGSMMRTVKYSTRGCGQRRMQQSICEPAIWDSCTKENCMSLADARTSSSLMGATFILKTSKIVSAVAIQ